MGNLSGINPSDYPDPNRYDPIPAGDYLCVIIDSEERKNKSGRGSHLKVVFEVLEGKYKGRKIWSNFNIHNPNPDAEQIGRAHLAAVCRAVGVVSPDDSFELHNKPMVVSVGIEKRKDTGDERNVTTAYGSEVSHYIGKDKSPDEPVAEDSEVPF